MLELGLRFPDPATVVVSLNEDGETQDAASQPFNGPLDDERNGTCTGTWKSIPFIT